MQIIGWEELKSVRKYGRLFFDKLPGIRFYDSFVESTKIVVYFFANLKSLNF